MDSNSRCKLYNIYEKKIIYIESLSNNRMKKGGGNILLCLISKYFEENGYSDYKIKLQPHLNSPNLINAYNKMGFVSIPETDSQNHIYMESTEAFKNKCTGLLNNIDEYFETKPTPDGTGKEILSLKFISQPTMNISDDI